MTKKFNQDQSFQIKSQLARLLSTENITVQHKPGAATAYFDVKNRLLVLPVWQNISEDLYDMLVVHETGHALDTPSDGWLEAIEKISKKHYEGNPTDKAKMAVKDYLNIIEDARIDKRQKRRYPGSKRNYVAGFKELMARDFFGVANKDVNSLSLIDRINLYFKTTSLQINFTKEEKAFVNRIANTETFEDVVNLTDELFGYCLAHKKEQETQTVHYNEDETDEDQDLIDLEIEYQESENENDDEYSNEKGFSSNQNNSEKNDEKSEEKTDQITNSGAGASNDPEQNVIPESVIEKAVRQNMSTIVLDDNIEYNYCTIPKPILSNIVDDFKSVVHEMEQSLDFRSLKYLKDLAEWKRKEADTISFMVKEFEMKKSADIYNRISVSKTGVIDTNKIHSYRYNDDIFRKLSVLPAGKNHGFVMLLDWSGSMIYNLRHTLKQLFSLVMFCKRVQIPFEVYLFRTATISEGTVLTKKGGCFEYKAGDIVLENFKLRNILSSRMNIATLNKSMDNLWRYSFVQGRTDPLNGTPLNQAIIALPQIVNEFQTKTKVQIVNTIILTDGSSDPVPGSIFRHSSKSYHVKRQMYILQDKETGISVSAKNSISYTYDELTNMLLRVLKAKTNANLIGFYLYSGKFVHIPFMTEVNNSNESKAKFWNENGYLGISSAGYDEYFIVDCRKLGTSEQDLKVNNTMTKAKIAREFMKFSSKKSINRVMLSKFIDRISKSAA